MSAGTIFIACLVIVLLFVICLLAYIAVNIYDLWFDWLHKRRMRR